jgi:DNA-binding SARP family transcriptional activator/DNA-binding beta-propeller fold protein YncE
VEFLILGPLQVLDGDTEVQLGSPKERALLAVLLLHAGAVVSRERLIDELWGESPPTTAAKALNVHVSQLRKSLGRNGHDPIGTRAPGYLIDVDADELDAARFEQRTAAAREHAAAGELAAASSLFRQALSLWRGPALAGLALESFARNELDRLEELRLTTLMDRVDCDLALGRHEQLVGELEAAVARHPLHERLRSQLMLALYRSDRQADALRAYQQARQTLVDELGLEPSPALQRLERGILNHDPALEAPSGVSRINERLPQLEANAVAPASAPVAGTPRPGLGRRTGVAVAAIAVAGAIAAAIVLMTRGSDSLAAVAPNSVAVIDAKSGKLKTEISVAANPGALAAGEGLVWLSNHSEQTVTEIDARTQKIVATVPLDNFYGSVTVGGGAGWTVEPSPTRLVVRLLPRSARPAATLRIRGCGSPPGAPVSTFAAGNLWFVCSDATFGKVGADGQRLKTRAYPGGYYSSSIAAAAGRLWILNDQRNVDEYDPATNEIEKTITVGDEAVALVAGAGSVWVANSGSDTVSRITIEGSAGVPPNVMGVRTINVGHRPTAIAYGERAIWVTNQADHTISRVDPATNVVTKTIKLGPRSEAVGIAVANKQVWLTTNVAVP